MKKSLSVRKKVQKKDTLINQSGENERLLWLTAVFSNESKMSLFFFSRIYGLWQLKAWQISSETNWFWCYNNPTKQTFLKLEMQWQHLPLCLILRIDFLFLWLLLSCQRTIITFYVYKCDEEYLYSCLWDRGQQTTQSQTSSLDSWWTDRMSDRSVRKSSPAILIKHISEWADQQLLTQNAM